MPQHAQPVELRPETVNAFAGYVRQAEADVDGTLHDGGAPFLWSQQNPGRWQRVRDGKVVEQFWSGSGPFTVPKRLVHDWIGSALIGGTTLHQTLALIQDYDNHENIYLPEVVNSKLLARNATISKSTCGC